MKTKIYDQNDFKKYFKKNDEFKEADLPEFIRNSISNKIIPKKSFITRDDDKLKDYINENYNSNNFNNKEKSIYNTNFSPYNNSENININNNTNNLYNFSNYYSPTTYSNIEGNQSNNQTLVNNTNCGFKKFLEKKTVYDRLSDLKDSIGKRQINSPILILSKQENDKSDLFNKITNASSTKYFVQSPKMLKSLISLNCKESKNYPEEVFQLRKKEKSYSSSKSLLNNLNVNNCENFNKSSKDSFFKLNDKSIRTSFININNDTSSDNNKNCDINRISFRNENYKNELGLIVKEPSKVNILHKIEQYKDYLRFKGV